MALLNSGIENLQQIPMPSAGMKSVDPSILDQILGGLGTAAKYALPGLALPAMAISDALDARARNQQAMQDTQGMDYGQLAQYWAARDPEKAAKYAELAQSQQPKGYGQTFTSGGRIYQLTTDAGKPVDLGPAPASANVSDAPKTRTINKGNQEVTQEWSGGKWVDVATAPRYKPESAGGGSLVQTIGPDGQPRFERVAPGGLPQGKPMAYGDKPLPTAAVQDIATSNASLGKIDEAIKQLDLSPNAFGAKTAMPNALLTRLDPSGVGARAGVFNLSSAIIKDRSGATVTLGESPRLAPFLPFPGDDAKTIKSKLQKLKVAIGEENNAYVSALKGSGYRVPQSRQTASPGMPSPEDISSELARRAKLRGGK